jgi:hypothetical protein
VGYSFDTSRQFCGTMDRAADSAVRSAATDISSEGLVNVIVGGYWLFAEQHCRTHDLSRLAIPALRDIEFNPGALQWVAQNRKRAPQWSSPAFP